MDISNLGLCYWNRYFNILKWQISWLWHRAKWEIFKVSLFLNINIDFLHRCMYSWAESRALKSQLWFTSMDLIALLFLDFPFPFCHVFWDGISFKILRWAGTVFTRLGCSTSWPWELAVMGASTASLSKWEMLYLLEMYDLSFSFLQEYSRELINKKSIMPLDTQTSYSTSLN